MTDWLLDQLAELPNMLLMAALGAVMLLDAIPLVGVLVPGDAAVLVATSVTDWLHSTGLLLGVVVGCLAGWSMTFVAGRYFGDRIRASRLGRWIGPERWAAAERALTSGGARMVMVAPFLPVLNALMPLAAGGLRMSYRRFVAFAGTGAALWAAMYVGLGTLASALGDLLPAGAVTTYGTIAVGMAFGWVMLLGMRRKLATVSAATGEPPVAGSFRA